jgi:hypothetical protein
LSINLEGIDHFSYFLFLESLFNHKILVSNKMPKAQYSVVDGLSRKEVSMMTPHKLKEIYDILLDEGNVEEEFDPSMVGEDLNDVGVREQQKLFRNYLLDLISSSDVESSEEKEETEDFYNSFAPDFVPDLVPEEKCRPEPDNFINCSASNMYCDIGLTRDRLAV